MVVSEISTRALSLYEAFLSDARGENIPQSEQQWLDLQSRICSARQTGQLDQQTATVAAVVAKNVHVLAHGRSQLLMVMEEELQELNRTFNSLLNDSVNSSDCVLHSVSRKRGCTSPGSPSPWSSPSPVSSSSPLLPRPETASQSSSASQLRASSLTLDPSDHLRLWFLDNLSNPYPTAAQKAELAKRAGIKRNKVDSDMTNWRRRAGWTEIKDRWCKGDKALMVDLIEGYDAGSEDREEVIEAIERMKAYLTKEKENSVGSWIENLKATKDIHSGKRKKARTSASSLDSLVDEKPKTPLFGTPSSSRRLRSTKQSSTPELSVRSVSGSSLRSVSDSSSSSSTLASSFNFKPYSCTPSSSTGSLSTVASSPEISVLGTKRSNDSISSVDTPNTRSKTGPSDARNVDVEWVPQFNYVGAEHIGLGMPYAAPDWSPVYEHVVYTEPHPLGAVDWSTTLPMPAHLSHMEMGYTQEVESFTLPTKHDFAFAMPIVEHAYGS